MLQAILPVLVRLTNKGAPWRPRVWDGHAKGTSGFGKNDDLAGWLVVWNIFLFFHILGIIIQTDYIVFFRGVGIPPTRLLFPIINHIITI